MEIVKRKFNEFEIAKAIAILGLPAVHFIEEAGYASEYMPVGDSALAEIIVFFSVFGPSVFMMCMGVRITSGYSGKRLVKNGIQFLIIGYLLDFFCFSLSDFIYWLMSGDPIYLKWIFEDLFTPDIYVFVGWFYVFYGTLRRLRLNHVHITLVSIALLIANSFTEHFVDLPENLGTVILDNFIAVNDFSYFPLCGWSIFVITGILLGDALRKERLAPYDKIMKKVIMVSVTAFVLIACGLAVFGISFMDILRNYADDYLMDVFSAALLMSIAGMILGVISLIYHSIRENALERVLLRLSASIMSFYIIQWLLVAFVVYYILLLFHNVEGCISPAGGAAVTAGIWIISFAAAYRYGFSLLRWVLKKTDYTRWFGKRKKA